MNDTHTGQSGRYWINEAGERVPMAADVGLGLAIEATEGLAPLDIGPEFKEFCIYPYCDCPFDAGPEPDWCARGLPHAPKPETKPPSRKLPKRT